MKITGAVVIILFCCVILGHGISFLEPNCGVSISGSRSYGYRIVGGGMADMYGNPWMALVRSSLMCGGSLITSRFVLSAAHCMTGMQTTVTLGEFDWSRSSGNAIHVPVDKQIPHPDYVHYSKNDIGLYRLARTVAYTDFIRPVCLPTNYNPLAQTTLLTATGWGKTEQGVVSYVLKTTTLTQQSRGTCSSIFGTNVDMSQICAGASNSHTCSGDSGGPITAKYAINGTNRVIQLGVVSYGEAYCRSVGVYTNVMHYMGWITNVVRRGGSQDTTAPTRSPYNNNNYYYPNSNSPTYYYTNGNSPNYYYPNGNSPNYYNPNGNSRTYYYPNSNSPSYSYPNGNSPTYYYPNTANYVYYG